MTQPPVETPRRRTALWVTAAAVVVVLVVVLVWWSRSSAAPAADASPSDTATPTPTPTAAASGDATSEPTEASSSPSAGGEGCAPTGDGIPADAGSADVPDVDGDGAADVAWLTPGSDRAFGITTASGATFSAPVTSASPIPARAVVNVVDGDIPIALVDTGREVLLFTLTDCAVTPTQNDQGAPYTFDKGFTGYGTGVGCTDADGVLRLAGLNAVDDGGTFTVTRTWVELSDGGRQASNGEEETVAEGAAPDDPVVTTAQETSCGDLVAGEDGPAEPQS